MVLNKKKFKVCNLQGFDCRSKMVNALFGVHMVLIFVFNQPAPAILVLDYLVSLVYMLGFIDLLLRIPMILSEADPNHKAWTPLRLENKKSTLIKKIGVTAVLLAGIALWWLILAYASAHLVHTLAIQTATWLYTSGFTFIILKICFSITVGHDEA